MSSAMHRMFPTRSALPAALRDKMVGLLNQRLADTLDLCSQTKQAHWNVKGPQFHQLHVLFDVLAENLEGFVDQLAERATALGGTAMGTVRMAAFASTLAEYPLDALDGMWVVSALAEKFAHCAAAARKSTKTAGDAGDAGTADLFTQLSRGLDKHLWFLEAHLQDDSDDDDGPLDGNGAAPGGSSQS